MCAAMPVLDLHSDPKQQLAEHKLYYLTTPGIGRIGRAVVRFFTGMQELFDAKTYKLLDAALADPTNSAQKLKYERERCVLFRYLPGCVQRECVKIARDAFAKV
jgi:hypothetical protein